MFIIDARGYLVGFSFWEADPLYTPVVGLYVDNAIVAHAVCELPPQSTSLEGPHGRYWFRLDATVEQLERIELGDPAVKLLRMEDAAPIRLQRSRGTPSTRSIHRVEDFLTNAERPTARLDGFPKYLTAPLTHQLDVLFIDILGRRPDPGAKDEYLPRLRQGEKILDIRKVLMGSREFDERRLTISDRTGSLMTSSLWTLLAQTKPLGERRPLVRQLVLSDYATLADHDFVIAVHRDCHGDDPTEPTVVTLADIAATHGRREVVNLLRRDAATGGRFFDLSDA
jgi:hypothetical protein